ncbi:hypothetical protein A6X21_05130 [Planctopirus hydrillae]|uniref:Uncharacterized protein n=2 Tax=Planctopirus hydrillae TaxID=1841610 RepID=A0A1C3EIU0_9PLAN|nr:hypothetical protein A6X21_05130 [Planctopirus hydrillae]
MVLKEQKSLTTSDKTPIWIAGMKAAVEGALADRGYPVRAEIAIHKELARFPRTPAHSVVGACGEACCQTVTCCIDAGPLTEQLYKNETLEQRIQLEIEDELPPDWRCRLTFIRHDPKSGVASELELPRLGMSRFGRCQLMKGKPMHPSEHWKTEATHPLVYVFLDDLRAASAPFLTNDAWEQIRPLLEQKWRRRLRYQVNDDAMIRAEDWELVLNSISYLFEKLGLPELNCRHLTSDRGFTTHTEASDS